jgi:hypothetical protein
MQDLELTLNSTPVEPAEEAKINRRHSTAPGNNFAFSSHFKRRQRRFLTEFFKDLLFVE